MARRRSRSQAWLDLYTALQDEGVSYTVAGAADGTLQPIDPDNGINYGEAVDKAVRWLQEDGRNLPVDVIDGITNVIKWAARAARRS